MADIPARFIHDLDIHIARALAGEPQEARALLSYFASVVDAGGEPDRRALEYLSTAFKSALRPGGDIAKSLGLVRQKPGNPGGARKKRRLTSGEKEEMAEDYEALMAAGVRHEDAIDKLVSRNRCGEATVKRAVRKLREGGNRDH